MQIVSPMCRCKERYGKINEAAKAVALPQLSVELFLICLVGRLFVFMYTIIQSNKVMGMEINNHDNKMIILPKTNIVIYSTSLYIKLGLNNVTICVNVVGHFLSHRTLLGCIGTSLFQQVHTIIICI